MLFADYLMVGMILGVTLITSVVLIWLRPGATKEERSPLKLLLKYV